MRHLVLFAFVTFTGTAAALTECYDESAFPAALRLEPTEIGMLAVLGGPAAGPDGKKTLTVEYDGSRWVARQPRSGNIWAMQDAPKGCDVKVPLPPMSLEEARQLREWPYVPVQIQQKVSACDVHGDIVFFGISIYQGEGVSGVGGVGRYDRKSGKVEIRRPFLLRDSSVTALAWDGTNLWIGTAGEHECSGLVPTHGLLRYEWDSGLMHQEPDFCGFVVHDLRLERGQLWAASDMGISQQWKKEGLSGWRHWTFDSAGAEPMRKEWCTAEYERLFTELSREPHGAGDSPFNYFIKGLVATHPDSVTAVVRRQLDNGKQLRALAETCNFGKKLLGPEGATK